VISVISDAKETTKSSEPTCELSELEESLGNDWKERTEADQAIKSGEIQALYSEKPQKESSPLIKVPEVERKQYAKIVFTEQDFTPVREAPFLEEALYEPSTTCTGLSEEKDVQSQIANSEEDEKTEKNDAEMSDTESQCDLNALEENPSSGVEVETVPTAFIEATVESDIESSEKEMEKTAENAMEEPLSSNEKTFAAMFSKEMTERVFFELVLNLKKNNDFLK